jgi:streptogramin lyase
LSRSGEKQSYPLPTPNAWPTGIALDADGNAWFT